MTVHFSEFISLINSGEKILTQDSLAPNSCYFPQLQENIKDLLLFFAGNGEEKKNTGKGDLKDYLGRSSTIILGLEAIEFSCHCTQGQLDFTSVQKISCCSTL